MSKISATKLIYFAGLLTVFILIFLPSITFPQTTKTITNSQPACVSVDPAFLDLGRTLDVTITGENTHFDSRSVVTFSCADITVNSQKVISATEIIVNITIGEDPALCPSDITVTTGSSEVVTCVRPFETEPPPPSCVSVDPSFAMPGSNLDVVITGVNTHFDTTSEVIYSCPGVTVNSVTATSVTTIIANITIAYDAPASCCGVECDIIVTTGNEQIICPESFLGMATCYGTCNSIIPSMVSAGETLDVNINFNEEGISTVENLSVEFECNGITVNSITLNSDPSDCPTEVKANITVADTAQDCTGNIVISGSSGVGIVCTDAFTVIGKKECTISVSPTLVKTGFLLGRSYTFIITGLNCAFDRNTTVVITGMRNVKITDFSDNSLTVTAWTNPVILSGKGEKTVSVKTGDTETTSKLIVRGLVF
jgi:hypothetical protein